MVNASVYAYENLIEYMKLYPKGRDKITENHLSALHINDKTVVLVSDTRDKSSGYKPDFSKSLVYFDSGEVAFKKYEDDFEPVTDVKVSGNTLSFYGQTIEHSFTIARKFGDISDGNVMGYILYDDGRPRLNVIMKPVQ